jgi:hypothetical protein
LRIPGEWNVCSEKLTNISQQLKGRDRSARNPVGTDIKWLLSPPVPDEPICLPSKEAIGTRRYGRSSGVTLEGTTQTFRPTKRCVQSEEGAFRGRGPGGDVLSNRRDA